jgi:hypothetical protein
MSRTISGSCSQAPAASPRASPGCCRRPSGIESAHSTRSRTRSPAICDLPLASPAGEAGLPLAGKASRGIINLIASTPKCPIQLLNPSDRGERHTPWPLNHRVADRRLPPSHQPSHGPWWPALAPEPRPSTFGEQPAVVLIESVGGSVVLVRLVVEQHSMSPGQDCNLITYRTRLRLSQLKLGTRRTR